MWTRRRFLASLAVGTGSLAGCQGRQDRPETTTRSSTTTAVGTTTAATETTDAATTANPSRVYVDAARGTPRNPGTKAEPLRSIQAGVKAAEPGDTVLVRPGEYRESVRFTDGGEPGAPVTVAGPPDAVLRSHPDDYTLVDVKASHVHLAGLTLTGLEDPGREVTERADLAYVSDGQLVQARPPTTTDEYLTDVAVMPYRIGYSHKALVSVERTTNAEVGGFEVVGMAGADYYLTDDAGHNGEIVYVGTSPSNLGTDWHPWESYDETRHVRVHHVDNAAGHLHSELVNTKLGTRDVLVEYCTDGGGSRNTQEWLAASVRVQGADATIRWNVLADGRGHGVEIAAHKAREALESEANPSRIERQGGTGNAVYGNRITGFAGEAVLFEVEGQMQADQRVVCGNEITGSTTGAPTRSCPPSVPSPDGGIGAGGGSVSR